MKRSALIAVGLGAMLLAAVLHRFMPESPMQQPVPEILPKGAESFAQIETVQARSFAWSAHDGRRASGPGRVFALQGETLRLTVRSDRADELHLHGYDLHLAVAADEPAVLEIKLERAGRFDAELRESNIALTTLEVMPRRR